MDQIKTGKLIAKLRKDKGMTQQQLADIFGINYRSVSKWETGQTMPDIANINLLSEIFGVTSDELLKGELNSKPTPKDKKKKHKLPKKSLLLLFIPIAVILVIVVLFLYKDSESESYMLSSANKTEYYVDGTVIFTNNDISISINQIGFLDKNLKKLKVKDYKYELYSNNILLYQYNYLNRNVNKSTTINELFNIITINFSNEMEFDKETYLNNILILKIYFIDEFDNEIVKNIEMNIVPKADSTQQVE